MINYSNMVALTGIHENVILSNLSSIGTKGAIESVRIHSLSVFWEGWIWKKFKGFLSPGTKHTVCNNKLSNKTGDCKLSKVWM